ncbi:hypothetical protein BDZ91DRAFT_752408, partial [Kalaharituber pfeilii]
IDELSICLRVGNLAGARFRGQSMSSSGASRCACVSAISRARGSAAYRLMSCRCAFIDELPMCLRVGNLAGARFSCL